MAGAVTITGPFPINPAQFVRKVTVVWTSDSSGLASGETSEPVRGLVLGIKTVPGTGGSQPNANYDVSVLDEDGMDLLGGSGSDRSSVLPQFAPAVVSVGGSQSPYPVPVDSVITASVSGAGDTKSGTVEIYYEAR